MAPSRPPAGAVLYPASGLAPIRHCGESSALGARSRRTTQTRHPAGPVLTAIIASRRRVLIRPKTRSEVLRAAESVMEVGGSAGPLSADCDNPARRKAAR